MNPDHSGNPRTGKGLGGLVRSFALVFLVFLVLKLTGEIDWSWWWIASPLWLLAVVVGVLVVVAAAILRLNEQLHRPTGGDR